MYYILWQICQREPIVKLIVCVVRSRTAGEMDYFLSKIKVEVKVSPMYDSVRWGSAR